MTVETATTPSLEKPSLSSVSQTGLSKKQEIQLINYVNSEFTKAKTGRWKAERQWYLNLAFYFGKQNIQTQDLPGSSRQFRLFTPPAPYYRSRPIVNKIRPLVRKEMSKLTAQKPSAFIVPASSDDRDMYAAMAGEQIWDSLFRTKKVHRVLRRAIFWATITGNGFMKTWWDEEKEDKVTNILGDICFESITPFHMFVPDLKQVEIEDQPYVIHAANRDLEQLQMLYQRPIKASTSQGQLLEESFTNVMGVDSANNGKPTQVLVLEAWIKPNTTKLWPSGGLITVAGSDILTFTEGMPYEHEQFPFAHIRHVESGKFYSDSVITDLIPLQREYNRTRGQIIESKNRMAKPQLAAEIGSVDPNKITSEPGQIILYRPGFQPPLPIPLQNLPSYVLEEQDRIRADMDEIAGQHEVSRGQVPPGVTAATAISYLQEQDESTLSYTFDSIEEGMEKVAYHTLCYVKQYWDTPRKIKVTGEDGSFDVLAFEGSDLNENTDIRVEAGSALPTSRAAKQAFIMDLMKMGFIDPNKGLEVLEIGGINKIYEQIQVDVRQAQRENLKMAQATAQLIEQNRVEQLDQFFTSPYGQGLLQQSQELGMSLIMENPSDGSLMDLSPLQQGMPPQPIDIPLIVPVNTWDDNNIHIERHNNYRKSQAYDNLEKDAKDLFEAHVNAHVAAIMVGAQGAMGMPPGMMEMANNPETVKQMQQQEPADSQLPPVTDPSQQQVQPDQTDSQPQGGE
jgi:hypothetical protein